MDPKLLIPALAVLYVVVVVGFAWYAGAPAP